MSLRTWFPMATAQFPWKLINQSPSEACDHLFHVLHTSLGMFRASWMLLGSGKPPKCPVAPEPLPGRQLPRRMEHTHQQNAATDGKGLLQSACGGVPGPTCTNVQSQAVCVLLILTFSFINIIEDADNFIKLGISPKCLKPWGLSA